MPTSLLDTVNSPDELRTLSPADLPKLAHELREFLVNSVGQTGGHLASNLGTVELTIALHYVFDTPRDRIVWDVGHQTYAHKILTPARRSRRRSAWPKPFINWVATSAPWPSLAMAR